MVINRLGCILNERGMKQKFLAEKAGISLSAMSAIVNGQLPQLENALKIAQALGMQVEDIWRLEG